MKAGLWRTDWFLGAVVVLVVLAFNRASDLIPSLEQKAYDLGVQSTSRLPSDKVAVIAIDDTSIANIGRWPWSREIHARMTDLLAGAKTKVIANTVFFSEPQIDPGYVYITKLLDLAAAPTPEMAPIVTLLKEAEQTLNTDRRLAESYVKAGNVLLPVFFLIDLPRGRPDRPLPEYFLKNAIPAKIGDDFGALTTAEVQLPVELMGRSAAALGHLSARPDVDGGVRTEPLVLRYFDHHFPSLSLMIAAKSLNLGPGDIKIQTDSVSLGRVAAYLTVRLPRLMAGPALVISGGAFAGLLVLHFALMRSAGIWMQLMLPATLLLIGHAALVSKRFIVTERAKLKSDETSAESNRMLGLAYQGQGQLDLAWDKFRQVPLSEALLDNLYNLALDFERKRQFNKAESVFRTMHEFNPKFRDLEFRLSRAKQLSETVILSGGASHPGGSLQLGMGEKPKFGRFEVQKELGKGAMGVVYLGKDPKIGREVAIKTMALSQEFEADELADVKQRFFREAETAGRLSHPNIVTIYDTGEEHDFCYIAMELLKGGDLAPYTTAGHLLTVAQVVSIAAGVADPLGYAHRQGVVHRDIKPANMMYHRESDTLKVTDFGIARLTDSSRTKTGMVLGTPSYMSPEQLAGKRIDGRSDLCSLGVPLYQLLCGSLPFEGESMAQLRC